MSERPQDCYRMLVQQVEIDCHLGVYDHEQQRKRPVLVDVELQVPVHSTAARDDQLAGTINYEQVVASIERITASRRFKLIESLCSELVDDLARLPGLRALRVTVTKPLPMPRARAVSVELQRTL